MQNIGLIFLFHNPDVKWWRETLNVEFEADGDTLGELDPLVNISFKHDVKLAVINDLTQIEQLERDLVFNLFELTLKHFVAWLLCAGDRRISPPIFIFEVLLLHILNKVLNVCEFRQVRLAVLAIQICLFHRFC